MMTFWIASVPYFKILSRSNNRNMASKCLTCHNFSLHLSLICFNKTVVDIDPGVIEDWDSRFGLEISCPKTFNCLNAGKVHSKRKFVVWWTAAIITTELRISIDTIERQSGKMHAWCESAFNWINVIYASQKEMIPLEYNTPRTIARSNTTTAKGLSPPPDFTSVVVALDFFFGLVGSTCAQKTAVIPVGI